MSSSTSLRSCAVTAQRYSYPLFSLCALTSSTGCAKGNSSSIRLLGQVGNFSNVSLSHAGGSIPLSWQCPAAFGWLRPVDQPARNRRITSSFYPGQWGGWYFPRDYCRSVNDRFPHSESGQANVSTYSQVLWLSLRVGSVGAGLDEPLLQGIENWLALLHP